MEVSVSNALIDSVISHGEFVWTNNALKEYSKRKEEIKSSNNKYVWYNKRNTSIKKEFTETIKKDYKNLWFT